MIVAGTSAQGVARPSQAHVAYTRLRRDIIRCRLLPGQEVTEAQLAEHYNVGKTPIREGLARLAHERLVRPLPRIGYRVTPITLNDTKELLVFRRIVESEAARLAAGHCHLAQLRRLDELCELPHDPKDARSVERLLRANVEFHAAVAAASGNAKLTAAVVQVLDEIARVLYLAVQLNGAGIELSHRHERLLKTLADGDGDAAAKVVTEQVGRLERLFIQTALNSPQVAVVNLAATAAT